jgi:phosphoribosylformylglycinamidine synthase
VVAEVPAASLADDAPVYSRPLVPPPPPAEAGVPLDAELAGAVLALAADPTCASKRWVWEQYDRFVGHGTVAGPGSDAAVLRVPGTGRAVALATDGNGRFAALDPAAGAAQALERAGVGAVRVAGECTVDLEERYFSHRRDHGRTGRQAGLIALVPGGGR